MFEYFSSIKREDGATFMKPSDLLAALVAVYPPDAGAAGPVRSGYLPGERAPRPAKDRHKPVRLARCPDPDPDPDPASYCTASIRNRRYGSHDSAGPRRESGRLWTDACWRCWLRRLYTRPDGS